MRLVDTDGRDNIPRALPKNAGQLPAQNVCQRLRISHYTFVASVRALSAASRPCDCVFYRLRVSASFECKTVVNDDIF